MGRKTSPVGRTRKAALADQFASFAVQAIQRINLIEKRVKDLDQSRLRSATKAAVELVHDRLAALEHSDQCRLETSNQFAQRITKLESVATAQHTVNVELLRIVKELQPAFVALRLDNERIDTTIQQTIASKLADLQTAVDHLSRRLNALTSKRSGWESFWQRLVAAFRSPSLAGPR